MYIVMAGGGMVGYYLCKALVGEGHEVIVIEKDRFRFQRGEEELGSLYMMGDGCEASVLNEAGTGRADIFIAVTNQDEDNLVACQVAKYRFQVPKTIARINNPRNEKIFRQLGIDRTVSVVKHILEDIEEQIPTHLVSHLFTLTDIGVELMEVKVSRESKLVGKRLEEIPLPEHSNIALLIRNGENPHPPAADTILQVGDRFIALTPAEHVDVLQGVFGPSPRGKND
jgi:trk system potassium uptake protein TrkA